VPNFVSFAASVAEPANGEIVYLITHSITQVTHPAYLMRREEKLSLWNNNLALWEQHQRSGGEPENTGNNNKS